MGSRRHRARDTTFLRLAAVAGAGGVVAIVTSVITAVATWRNGHPGSTFFFFSLWGLAALAGAAANVMVYFQSGDPPEKPPRGGRKVVAFRTVESPPARPAPQREREAA